MTVVIRNLLLNIPRDLARTLRGIVDFNGSATRSEVWTYQLLGGFLASLATGGLQILTGEPKAIEPTVASSIVTIFYLLPSPALFARRLHDMGKSGWPVALMIPFFMLAALTENATPHLVWVDKVFSGWPAILAVVSGILALLFVSLAPPKHGRPFHGPDRRTVDSKA